MAPEPDFAAAAPPPDHPDRLALAEEVHARPPEALETPSRASCVAVLVAPEARAAEQAHLAALCDELGVAAPAPGAIHFSADLGPVRLRWERHGEFSNYSVFASGLGPEAFAAPPSAHLPAGWLAGVPGETLFAGHAELIAGGEGEPDAAVLGRAFDGHVVVGARVGGGAALALTDFRIHADGFSRFLLFDLGLTPRQAGRMIQRLFEIETYRMMAMLALPVARAQGARIVEIERALTGLTSDIALQSAADETLLAPLTRLAAEVESGLAASQFRFGACRAYHDLVTRRIAELREQKLPGIQTIEEFMGRRFTPAVATCASAAQRLHDLSERVGQASALLTTRVEIAREQQNHRLLGSMARRATLQLRLQQTVEIVSVAPITYYLTGLVGYVARALRAAGAPVDPELAEGIAIPIVAVLIMLFIWRVHHRLFGPDRARDDAEAFDA